MKTHRQHGSAGATQHSSNGREGFALIVVLLVLLALLVLTTPFLASARNADQASTQLSERASARVGLEAATTHMRVFLSDSYPSADMDKTPYWDGLDEIHADNKFDPEFLNPNDPRGPMWDVDLQDVAGQIDLNSASPYVFANMMGLSMRFGDVITPESKELPLGSASGLEDTGFLWCEGEIVQYTKIVDGTVTQFVRGVFGPGAKTEWRGGPRPKSAHGAGTPVVDQRAFAPALWRLGGNSGGSSSELRTYEALEELPQCGMYSHAVQLAAPKDGSADMPEVLVRPLLQNGSVYAGARGGPVWQRATRVTSAVEAKKDGKLRVENGRWLNIGATVRIRDGQTSELALVQNVLGNGEIALDRILQNDYEAYAAVLEVLVRRPVNINTANRDVLRILFTNLQVTGHNSRITNDEADKLADLVVESRPLTGLEDFLRRIVLPSAGIERLPSDAPVVPEILQQSTGFLDPWDAVALYMNGLDANDSGLQYSTMPYSFTTRDTYACEMRSTINAPSGVERFTLIRDQVMLVVPQKELTRLWSRQEDFEEEFRLTGDAPFWATGPSATTRYDGGSVPPSRMWAHLGTFEDQLYLPGVTDTSKFKDQESPPTPEHIFASREAQGWVQLATLREDDASARRKGRVLHFDNETRDLEGRYLPDQIVKRATDDKQIKWTGANAIMLRPLSMSMWIKPKAVGDAKYLDVGGVSGEVDHLSLMTEGPDLVLRVIDGFGDNNLTTLKEVGELRYAIGGGNSPGLPADTWSHIEFDVRGNRPTQMHMLVNGMAYGVRTPGMSRLAGGLSQGSSTIAVESTEGFPEVCVVRIGKELIEVQNRGNGVLDASRQETGKLAGFGGRLAREEMTVLTDTGTPAPINLANITTSHPQGTPVELFGYSLPTSSSIPTGEARVPADLGPFRVAIVRGVVGGASGGANGEPITYNDGTPMPGTAGGGMLGVHSGVTGLVLASADDGLDISNPRPVADYMSTFQRDGGYAAIIQVNPVYGNVKLVDSAGANVGGIEIIRYTGVQDATLLIDQSKRGIGPGELPDLATSTPHIGGGPRSFVVNWDHSIGGQSPQDPTPWWRSIKRSVFVIPISVGVPGAGTVNGFLDGMAGNDHFAQYTHVDDAENTEWVQYDRFVAALSQLVRDDPISLELAYRTLTHNERPVIPPHPMLGPGDGTPGGDGGAPPGGSGGSEFMMLASEPVEMIVNAEPIASAASTAQSYGTNWDPRIGQAENKPVDWPISRAVEINFQFRGVCGTYSHKQQAGTPIHPVFEVHYFTGVDGGRPGRMDAIFLSGSNLDHVGWPVRVHRAYVFPPVYDQLSWDQPPVTHGNSSALRPITAAAGAQGSGIDSQTQITPLYLQNRCFVALQQRGPEPLNPGSAVSNTLDSRQMTRLVCFPSGERPRLVTNMTIGGGVNGAQGVIPSAVIDEVVFGDAQFGRAYPAVNEEDTAGASLFLMQDADEGAQTLTVAPKSLRVSVGNVSADHLFLNDMTPHGGLLRVGDEIVAYKSYGADAGEIHVATNGRGLLGTKPGAHQAGEPLMFLEERVITTLSSPLSAGDARLKVESTDNFPLQGVVLVGQELIGYTRLRDSSLEMPRASSTPGKMDQKGDGIFRGRYGTTMAAHATGEAVILFPVRYPDRWSKRADAPELSYFGLSISQPAAYVGSCFFSKIDTSMARIGVLQRTDPAAPWDIDTDAGDDTRVKVLWQGEKDGAPLTIGKQSDRVDWRVFVQFQPGAFDAKTGLSHGWKETPRLKLFSAFYHAPSLVLRSVER